LLDSNSVTPLFVDLFFEQFMQRAAHEANICNKANSH